MKPSFKLFSEPGPPPLLVFQRSAAPIKIHLFLTCWSSSPNYALYRSRENVKSSSELRRAGQPFSSLEKGASFRLAFSHIPPLYNFFTRTAGRKISPKRLELGSNIGIIWDIGNSVGCLVAACPPVCRREPPATSSFSRLVSSHESNQENRLTFSN
jgi:hypothetical protein